jgi:hypothetical protein
MGYAALHPKTTSSLFKDIFLNNKLPFDHTYYVPDNDSNLTCIDIKKFSQLSPQHMIPAIIIWLKISQNNSYERIGESKKTLPTTIITAITKSLSNLLRDC